VVLFVIAFPSFSVKAQDPISVVIQQGITKVIRAVDLKVQRLQNRTIWLQNAQKTVENAMSKIRLEEIAGWVDRQRLLYQDYFLELQEVKTAITDYHTVQEIFELQLALVRAYHSAIRVISRDTHFSLGEVKHMREVYGGILSDGMKSLQALQLVLQPFVTQMTDAERLKVITEVKNDLQKNYDDLRRFTQSNRRLSLARAKSTGEIESIKAWYGIQ
jgi:hypothetical protein